MSGYYIIFPNVLDLIIMDNRPVQQRRPETGINSSSLVVRSDSVIVFISLYDVAPYHTGIMVSRIFNAGWIINGDTHMAQML